MDIQFRTKFVVELINRNMRCIEMELTSGTATDLIGLIET